jgi:type VI secretion system protein ImpC
VFAVPISISFGRLDVGLVASLEATRAGKADPASPFKIAVLGDFSGRENRGTVEPMQGRRIHRIDRDNFDEILKKCGPRLGLPILGKNSAPITMGFAELDDFHPDNLYQRIEIFQALRDTRKALQDPKVLAALAKQDRESEIARAETPRESEPSMESMVEQAGGGLLDQVIGVTEVKTPDVGTSLPSSEWDRFLRDLVRPHFEPDILPQQRELTETTDAATGELMRRILHHPDFQALEAAWRGLKMLVSRLETEEQLQISILDVSKAELAKDLLASDDLHSSGLYQLLVEQTVGTPGGEPWAVVAGGYTFDQTREDLEVLGRIARIMRPAGAPFIAAAHPHLIGCESLAATPDPRTWRWLPPPELARLWQELRALPEAPYLGLALPRLLLRLPYGSDTEPTERFDFEEIPAGVEHGLYLWGNPALACVCLLGQAFSEQGWDLRLGDNLDVVDLPLHTYKQDGESRITPCAEVLLTVDAAERILDKGIMPLVSFKNQDRARLARFQSIAYPLTNLAGRWQ